MIFLELLEEKLAVFDWVTERIKCEPKVAGSRLVTKGEGCSVDGEDVCPDCTV